MPCPTHSKESEAAPAAKGKPQDLVVSLMCLEKGAEHQGYKALIEGLRATEGDFMGQVTSELA